MVLEKSEVKGIFSLMNLNSVLDYFQMVTVFCKIRGAKPLFAIMTD